MKCFNGIRLQQPYGIPADISKNIAKANGKPDG
jgi:hypothetical protein